MMKITFLSVCSNFKRFHDYIYTIGKSFELHNDFEIDWIIYTNVSNNDLSFNKIKLYLRKTEKELSLYDLFCLRLYKLLELKNEYDIICLVDLDILFLESVFKDIKNVFESDCVVGCQKMNLNHTRKLFKEVDAYSDRFLNLVKDKNYVNTGFSIINTKNIFFTNKDITEFIENIKNDTYCFDEAFLTFQKQYMIDNLQDNKDVFLNKNGIKFKVVHFSFGRYLLEYDIYMNKYVKIIYKKYIRKYYEITTESVRKIIKGYL